MHKNHVRRGKLDCVAGVHTNVINRMWRKLIQQWRGHGRSVGGVWLDAAAQHVLVAVHEGWALRSQRDLEGNKRYLLQQAGAEEQPVARDVVLYLREHGLLETNHKFPAATFLLTSKGSTAAAELAGTAGSHPVSARNFTRRP